MTKLPNKMKPNLRRPACWLTIASGVMFTAVGCTSAPINSVPHAPVPNNLVPNTPAPNNLGSAAVTDVTQPPAVIGAATPLATRGDHRVPTRPSDHLIPTGVTTVNYEAQPTGLRHFGVPGSGACGCVTETCRTDGCEVCGPVVPYGVVPPTFASNVYGVDPQEFLCDGGDQFGDATVRQDDTVAGLQLEDTVAHYTTESGDIEVAASNKVCVYAPRFKSVRQVTGAVAEGRVVGLSGFGRRQGPTNVDARQGGVAIEESIELAHADVSRGLDALRERNRGVPVENVLQLEQASDVLALLVDLTFDEVGHLQDEQKAQFQDLALAAIAWSKNESVEVEILDLKPPVLTRDQNVESFTVYDFPDAGRVRIVKLADRDNALPGEFVNFAIRVENVGDSAISNVVIRDNLTTRLEYVDQSQTSTIDAQFSTSDNDGESLELAWKLNEKLKVGDAATIRFRCRVR